MEVFDSAAHLINFAHQFVMARTDEEFAAAFELLLTLARRRHQEAFDAPAVLVQAFEVVLDRSIFDVERQEPEKTPITLAARSGTRGVDRLRQACRLFDLCL